MKTESQIATLATRVAVLPAKARDVRVINQASHDEACDALRRVAALKRGIKEIVDPMVHAAHRAHKEMTEQRARLLGPVEEYERVVKRAIAEWLTTERRRINEERRILGEAARKIEEERRLIEATRMEQDALAARDRAAAMRARGEKAEAEAIEGQAAARQMLAEAALDLPIEAPAVVVAGPEKVAGVSARVAYSAQVTDFMALVVAVAQGRASMLALKADETFLRAQARALGHDLRIPGVRVVEETIVSVR